MKVVDGDGVTMLYEYNTLGERTGEVVDVNRNSVVDANGPDRIARSVRAVTTGAGGVKVNRTTATQYLGNNGTPTTVAVTDERLDGRKVWTTRFGLLSTVDTALLGNGQVEITTTFPDASTVIQTMTNGRVGSVVRKDSSGAVVGEQQSSYADPYNRLTSTSERVNGALVATSYTYTADDQIATVTTPDPDGAGPQVAQVATYFYDAVGRQWKTVLPDGTEVYTSYFPDGQVKEQSGSRTYPTAYTYDAQGRIKTLKTRQGGATWAAATGVATTTWTYDPLSGLLANKRYTDANGPDYTYTPGGRLFTREWARAVGAARLKSTYGYTNAGELETQTYNDGITPPVTYTYDRAGRPETATDGPGTRTFTWRDDGQLDLETHGAGSFSGLKVDPEYDTLARRNGVAVVNGATSLHAVTFGYDEASRLKTVTQGAFSAVYGRETMSDRIQTITHKNGTADVAVTSRGVDNLGRLTSIGTVRGEVTARSFGYGYNAANQRTGVTWEDGSKWAFGYDTLGQVTSGARRWADDSLVAGQQFGYEFDSIGNRATATRNGRTATYTPDTLNQYDQKTVPGFVDVTGEATASANVTVNNEPTSRKGTYFYKEEIAINTAAPVLAELKTVAVKSNADAQGRDAVLEATKYAFIPQTPEVFVHDDDGNLTEDGQFIYTWDGENRLIKVETKPAAVAVGAKKVKQEAEFDHRNLRVRVKLSEWISGAWSVKSDLRMVYDGWTVLAELRPDNTIERANTWGLDLSGSEQGAGGVGGALFVSIPDGATRTAAIPLYDGNGNITGLLNASTGITEALYEYGPFGETLRETGRLASANVLRWSTKREDSAVGLMHYELRDYKVSTGRWVSRDPIGEEGGLAVYQQSWNNPISWYDSAGLAPKAADNRSDGTFLSPVTTARLYHVTLDAKTREPKIELITNFKSISGKGANIWINGMANTKDKAADLGGIHTKLTNFYMIHNPSNGAMSDFSCECTLQRVGLKLNVDRTSAELLAKFNLEKSTVYAHSQGTMILNMSIKSLHEQGVSMNGMKTIYHGSAANYFQSKRVNKCVGAFLVDFDGHPLDAVHNIVGLNTKNPLRIGGSIIASPLLFVGGKNWSPHTTDNGGKLKEMKTWWIFQ